MNHSVEVISDLGVYSEEQKDSFTDANANSLEDTAGSKLRRIPNSSPLSTNNLNDKDKDDIRQQLFIDLGAVVNNDLDARAREAQVRESRIANARIWVGILVYKEINGKGYMGEVQDYDQYTNLYQIKYEEVTGYDEQLTRDEMLLIVAHPDMVCEYLDRKEAKENNERKKSGASRAKASSSKIEHENLTGYDDELAKKEMMQTASPSPPIVYGKEEKARRKETTRALRARAINVEMIPAMKQPRRKRTTKKAKVSDYVPLAFREKKRDAYYWY